MSRRLLLIRVIVVVTALTGLNYITWRWLFSINFDAWYIAFPLILAETYSLIDSLLFGFGIWRLKERPAPPPPPDGLTVDVLITTYNEPVDLVMTTALAAKAIRYPHQTWILDDGNRPEMRAAAEEHGIGWISRSEEWAGMPRHAKAGNLNNALVQTDGEFLLILDADQVPTPEMLDATLGYFDDPEMGLVQTPQFFVNVPESDPLGSQAPLFYGPIQQSKDGWNSAFFCGSNAVIRREALVQIGVARYAGEIALRVYQTLYYATGVLKKARKQVPAEETATREALLEVEALVRGARKELADGEALFDVTYRFQRSVDEVRRRMVDADLSGLQADLAEIAALGAAEGDQDFSLDDNQEALARLAERDWSPMGAIESVTALVDAVDVDRGGEAQAVMPMATISVTEDMATCMRMHGLGWKSAYHDTPLAFGLAPEDLKTMLTQRLRWAQGTMQVMFRENPLTQKRLSWPQRLMYFSTMWSYLSGFAAIVYLAAPVLFLVFGVLPVQALSSDFFLRLIPFLVINQLLFIVVSDGRPTWRGMQYSLALFPTWIRAFTSAFGNVFMGRSLDFAVTPKEKQDPTGPAYHLIKPQLFAIGALLLAVVIGTVRMITGDAEVLPTLFNFVWVGLDLALISVIVQAARYRGFEPGSATSLPATAQAALRNREEAS
ncbi:cellulose synthase (UDP-forming) [Nocardioides marinisabuli]|uniref:Cellulose synthase (UDP-forming) n=1 Tax=Nocardioides marinisabuli TaxID=419476 RepID=A0A7Y9JS69_9ACTN|nr:glycosyltransferase family 2 protein [Nocardioides marinisabuli]NYD59245.1 cellulose synthase (UDP-forming) [Nocardioides marinisabuli]